MWRWAKTAQLHVGPDYQINTLRLGARIQKHIDPWLASFTEDDLAVVLSSVVDSFWARADDGGRAISRDAVDRGPNLLRSLSDRLLSDVEAALAG